MKEDDVVQRIMLFEDPPQAVPTRANKRRATTPLAASTINNNINHYE